FSRASVSTGAVVREYPALTDKRTRLDQRLLRNLGAIRRNLQKGLDDADVNSLIARSIFIRYLEDRGILDAHYMRDIAGVAPYSRLLQTSKDGAYRLYTALFHHFNGDVFPDPSAEEQRIGAEHLRELGRFLDGASPASGQMYFWAYDFSYIPIELIS